ncbi:hypothetical protein [Asticcacaulis machinosus]|uniref:Secreted protein n=1 Tax=Asticcacaulis machinosus TaxID=2984211 RepID=A0ABT5HEZ8_9CAUL|nr:hypothetical protein [Asticcacaulis machinosus]MDC7674833.1 hypothetical protein [Asticcacaulis machinosus]
MRIRFLCLSFTASAVIMATNPAMSQTQPVCAPDKRVASVVPVVAPIIAPVDAPSTQVVVRDLERDEKGFPKWSNFPSAPQNVPTASDIKQRVSSINGREDALETAVARLSWDMTDPVAYSASTRNRLNSDLSRPVTKNSCNEIHQFALTQRAKAVPPPSADR